jgi:bifunctional non-homologous end joining protein LigD
MQRGDAIAYYDAIRKFILPHLRNRPVSFRRFVDSIPGDFFWEKDAPSFTPEWVKRFAVPRREGGPPIEYIVVNDAKTLLWLASVGGIEIHPFLHKVPKIELATQVVFDLDPGEGTDLRDAARVALLLRDALAAMNLACFAKVSGGKGIQVYVPLNGNATHDDTESFARIVAEEMARAHPKLIVAKMAKALRHKKIFIDWSQNADYKTTIGVYSLRETGFVSMPVQWNELASRFTASEAIARVKKVGDLFAPVLKLKQRLPITSSAKRTKSPRRPKPEAHLPKFRTQSGRRLFLITKTEMGNELWMDMRGRFKRWILRPDREGDGQLIAMPAGDFNIDPAYLRAEVPKAWKGRVKIEDSGAYEVIEGSWQRRHFELWFNGQVMRGAWTLAKIEESEAHRSWRLAPR